MHFRHLLITGLFVGAAMLLPDNAFAEQNDPGGPKNTPAAVQQVIPAVEMDQAAVKPGVPDKEKAVSLPAHALNNQGEEKRQPAEVSANNNNPAVQRPVAAPQPQKQAASPQKPAVASQKPPAASHNLPEQAKGNVQSGENKSVKSIRVLGPETPAQKQKNEAAQKIPTSKNEVRISALDTFHIAGMEKKNNIQPKKFEQLETIKENLNLTSAAITENHSITPMQTPLKQGNIPSGKEEIPKASQMPSPTQRTSSQGGQSNERMNLGLNGVYFPDKWFAWNQYYEIQLVQSYQSRQIGLNNQWVNAPPSPPPQEAPLLETVTCS